MAQDGGKVVSLAHRPPLPQEMFLVLISVRGWVDPRAIVRSEVFCVNGTSWDRTSDLPICSTATAVPTFWNVTRCNSSHRHCNFREKWHFHLHTQHGGTTFLWKLIGQPEYASSRFGTSSSVFIVATWEIQISGIFILQETTGHFRLYLYSGCTRLNIERFAGHRGWGVSYFYSVGLCR